MYEAIRSRRVRAEYANDLLTRIGVLNLPLAREFLRAKQAQGVKPGTSVNIAHTLAKLDELVQGQDFRTLTPADLTSALELFSRSHKPSSCRMFAVQVRAFYAWLNDGQCPRGIHQALRRVKTAEFMDVAPLTPEEFQALLRAAHDPEGDPREVARRLCLLWVLWDSGFRVSEALSLRIESVLFDSEGGAKLTLPRDGLDLKTGPRAIYVVECAGAIKVWLSIHPRKDDFTAPLFASHATPTRSIHPTEVQKLLARLSKKAGIRHVHPHLFRHTRASRAAEAGWVESELRAYFGWSGRSSMPSHYVHLSKRHMTERVRRDANLDPLVARIQADPKAALQEAVSTAATQAADRMAEKLLSKLGLAPAARQGREEKDEG